MRNKMTQEVGALAATGVTAFMMGLGDAYLLALAFYVIARGIGTAPPAR